MIHIKKSSKLLALTLSIIMCITLLGGFTTKAFAENDIKVTVDGKQVQFTQPPVIKDGRTLVPIRAIFEAMGYQVTWYPDTQQIKALYNDNYFSINMTIGSTDTYFGTIGDGCITNVADVPPQIINGSTFVPLRVLGEDSGADVTWNEATKTVEIDRSKHRQFDPLCYNDNITKNVHYDGEWVYLGFATSDYVPDGIGKFTYINDLNKDTYINAYYIGTFVKGVKEGQGVFHYAEGSIYTGQFHNDEATGKGTIHLWNGDIYTGDFVNGDMDGYGTYFYKNGTIETGKWSKGMFMGNM